MAYWSAKSVHIEALFRHGERRYAWFDFTVDSADQAAKLQVAARSTIAIMRSDDSAPIPLWVDYNQHGCVMLQVHGKEFLFPFDEGRRIYLDKLVAAALVLL